MLSQSVYFVDMNILYHIFLKNIWYLVKLIMVAYVAFYWIPVKIFPQEHAGKGIEKIIFNMVYMVAYIETVIPFLVFIKAFSIVLFIFILILTKLAFMKYYYHQDVLYMLKHIRVDIMMWFFDIMDKTKEMKNKGVGHIQKKVVVFIKRLTFYPFAKKLLFFTVFAYIISTLMARGLYSYSNPIPDTSQFINWVDNLQQNILYADTRVSADFYGQAIMDFFVNIFTNIDPIILFSLYPILLLGALYLSIFYVVKDFTGSQYTALFAVMIHGIILMSPLSNYLLGKVITTTHYPLVDFYGLKIYFPQSAELLKKAYNIGDTPYLRYISGLAYEHSSVFVLLNAYFLIKTLQTHLDRYLLVYALTLLLVFTFHGGGAITLVVVSVLIAINSVIFRKLNLSLLKKGLLAVIFSSIVGNLWILSMIKYGIPQDFGAAAPFLDKMFKTANSMKQMVKVGAQAISICVITKAHIVLVAMAIFSFVIALFTKRRFVVISYLLIVAGIFVLYFGTNIGLPMLANQSRLAEYMFFGITLLLAFYFFYLFYHPISLLLKKYTKYFMLFVSYVIFVILVLTVPRWMDTNFFWRNINQLEYTSISDIILKINSDNRPFDWTVVSYIQEYSKVRNKGYHINTQNFILKYNPEDKELKIITPKIYIFVENFPNPYEGKGEWYYRWRSEVQSGLKSWIAIYSANHSNIRVYYKTKTVTVYEIDNSEYVNRLKKLKFKLKMQRLRK